MRRTSTLTAALAALALVPFGLGAQAAAEAPAAKPAVTTLAKGLVSPLSVAVSEDGTVYYTQNFAGLLQQRTKKGKTKVLYGATNGDEVGAVSEYRGSLRFATTGAEGDSAALWGIGGSGKPVKLADLLAHEKNKNPDAGTTYGFRDLDAECAAEIPEEFGPASYPGIVESHPYATRLTKHAGTYVADAAGNTILQVTKRNKVRTVAVLPGQPVVATTQLAEAFGLPECVVGETYWFEAVPTDVEKGPDGKLYVSTLPGGPEDGTGAAASVYRVDPKSGKVTRVATGMVSATGLAVAPNGDIYVAQLFGGSIVKVKKGTGKISTVARTLMPGDVEMGNKASIFATTHVLVGDETTPPGGRVVRIKP